MVEDIKVIAEKEFSFLLDNTKILMTKGFFGDSFSVIVGSGISGSCS